MKRKAKAKAKLVRKMPKRPKTTEEAFGEEDGEGLEGRNKQWVRDGTKMIWLRVTPGQRDAMDAAVRAWNAAPRVVGGRSPRLTRTGLILDAVDAYIRDEARGMQLELPGTRGK